MSAKEEAQVAKVLLALENAALARWCVGDPAGFLEICAADVVYFDPFLEQRLDGITALAAYYQALRGKISADRFDLLGPRVQCAGGMAVLTFNFISFSKNAATSRWNCTEVYRQDADGWRIIQTHWSFTRPRIS